MNPLFCPSSSGILESLLLARGLECWALLGPSALAAEFASSQSARQSGDPGMARGAVVVALPYDPRPARAGADESLAGGPAPYLRVGAFASAHRYAGLARMLKALAKELAAALGYTYSSFRVAVNSRLPEKRLAELAGLGYRGRSDLLLTHAYGPACILGVLLLPFDPLEAVMEGNSVQEPLEQAGKSRCETCNACAVACPGKAINGDWPVSPKTYHRASCIQHWMSTMDEPPRALLPAFTGRLYGCDACILACPLSTGAWLPDREDGSSPASRAEALLLPVERRPGSLVSAAFLARAGDPELKAFFRKTAMGLSWFGPGMIRHNLALASQGSGSAGGAFDDR